MLSGPYLWIIAAREGILLNISYVKADPGGNTTILVLDAVPASRRAAVAGAILACPDLAAEQVGYIRFPAGAENGVRIDMMGGEFCGNASRSAAAVSVGAEKGAVRRVLFRL